MRPLILKMDITLDGFVGAADGDVQWAIDDFGDPALQEWMLAGLWDAVFSSTLTDPEWADTRVLSGDLATEIAALKAEDGKPILLHGGASFARSLSALGLIDEYRLLVHPIALGEGLPLFGARTRLRLTSARTFATGIVASTFVPG
jgi:dihydrofolate reductase